MQQKLAVIDCGTNTFNLLIASFTNHKIQTHFEDEISVRIGKNGINDGIITPLAANKSIEVIKNFQETIQKHNIDSNSIIALATSAFRNARNGQDLKDEIYLETGIRIEIIDGNKEAELIYKGVSHAIDFKGNGLVMDIGGGSVEFIIGDKNGLMWKESFEIGAQRLVSLFQINDPITAQEIKAIEAHVTSMLTNLFENLRLYRPTTIIGASGTFETLSHIYSATVDNKKSSPKSELDFDISAYNHIHQQLVSKNINERAAIPGMSAMRVDMIAVASSIINTILNEFTFENFRISRYALKEGALFQIYNRINKTN